MSLSDAERLRRELLLRAMFPIMSGDALARFAEQLLPMTVKTGEILFETGTTPERVYFLLSGKVAMRAEGEEEWSFGPRSAIGVIDALIGRPRARRCIALADTELLALPVSEWLDLLEDDANSARGAIRNFSRQILTRWQASASTPSRRTSTQPPTDFGPALSTYDKILALRRAEFLKPAGMQAIASLAAVAEEERYESEQSLFEPGHTQQKLQLVVSGGVELRTGNDFLLVHGPGELVGGPAAFSGALTQYAARAAGRSVVLAIHEQDYYDQVEEHVRLTRGTLAYLVTEFERVLKLKPPSATDA